MVNLRDLLQEMIDKGASDLHITAGVPPQLRVDGEINPTEHDPMTPEMCQQIVYSVLNEEQQKRFEELKELDFSFGVKGLSRFRGNVFMQRGVTSLAIRQIPYDIRSFKDLGLLVIDVTAVDAESDRHRTIGGHGQLVEELFEIRTMVLVKTENYRRSTFAANSRVLRRAIVAAKERDRC